MLPVASYQSIATQTRLANARVEPEPFQPQPAAQPMTTLKVDAETQFRARPAPVLANGARLCEETRQLANGAPPPPEAANVLPTTYSRRQDHTAAANLGANLLLDMNMHFEERLQHGMEHLPNAVRDLKRVVGLVHGMIGNEALPVSLEKVSAEKLLDMRLDHLRTQLSGNFNKETLDRFFAARNGSDTAIERFVAQAAPALTSQQMLQVKLLKMLFAQLPYFGGSVEYKLRKADSLEFWIYHLSTLTRDPARAMNTEKGQEAEHMLKPMRDYLTPEHTLVARNNQRNLGTGIAEANWQELPLAVRGAIGARLAEVLLKPQPDAATLQARHMAQALQIHFPEDVEARWDALKEDGKKIVYGDIAALPWSDAHLQELGGAFELDYDTNAARADEPWLGKHPDMHGLTGVQNVAGVHGNVLEIPEIAAQRYIGELRKKVGDGPVRVPLQDARMSLQDIQQDFEGKHGAWYGNAYANHRPIVGGMSGHTLGYLNLYKDALAKHGGAAKGPSMEKLRALLLAALVGNKRHHSYDEVMVASKGIAAGDVELDYKDAATYNDVLKSSDPDIQQAAAKALDEARNEYAGYDSGTVLATLCDQTGLKPAESAAFRKALNACAERYYSALQKDERDALASFPKLLENVIHQYLPQTGALLEKN